MDKSLKLQMNLTKKAELLLIPIVSNQSVNTSETATKFCFNTSLYFFQLFPPLEDTILFLIPVPVFTNEIEFFF